MKITICCSLRHQKQLVEVSQKLKELGHEVFEPIPLNNFDYQNRDEVLHSELKQENNLMKKHFEKIQKSDAILVLNYDKGEIKNYIGGNTFLEIGIGYFLNKKIFLMNSIPNVPYSGEIQTMQPIVLNGELREI